MSQADLARVLGKSKAWVSQHAAMHALPDPIAEAAQVGMARLRPPDSARSWGQRQQGQA